MTLRSSQLRGLMDGLAGLYSAGPGDFPAWALRVVSTVTSAESRSYNHFGQAGVVAVHAEPQGIYPFPDALAVFEQYAPQHPVLAYYRASGDGRARRISDFLSDRQFRALALYREFYRRTGVNYQVAFAVPLPDGGLIGMALGRQRRDFTDEEIALMDLLRPHIAQAAAIAGVLPQPRPGGPRSPDGAPLLTSRQESIVQLVAAGHTDRHIARSLGISTRTVHAHLRNIYQTLGVSSRTEALARLRAATLPAGPAGQF